MVTQDIPAIGKLVIKNGIAAVIFQQSFTSQVQGIVKRPMSERKQMGNMGLNKKELQNYELSVPESATMYLRKNLNIDVHNLSSQNRPKTAKQAMFASEKNLKGQFELTQQKDLEFALDKLHYYIRDKQLNQEDAFLDICNLSQGRTSSKNP